MSETAADILINSIIDWVDTVFGLPGEEPGEIRPALESALRANKPSIVEVTVDPYEPPMPSKVTLKQAANFAQALVRGQPEGGRIALTLFRDKLNELV